MDLDFLYNPDGTLHRYRMTERYIIESRPDLHAAIQKSFGHTWSQRLWHFVNGPIVPSCSTCDGPVKFWNFVNGYRKFCSPKCCATNQETEEKKRGTSIERYGVEHHFMSQEIKDKRKSTFIANYGVDHPWKSDKIQKKIKDTNSERYGGAPAASKLVRDKMESTNLNRYGAKNAMQSEPIKSKVLNANLSKYGAHHQWSKQEVSDFIRSMDVTCDRTDSHFVITCACGNTSEISASTFYKRVKAGISPCTECNPIYNGKSDLERSVLSFIKTITDSTILTNTRKSIGLELDIYLPELGVAIEINGLYWHSELFKDKNYHIKKTEKCESLGIRLIHIFEDDWHHKGNIVRSRLANIFNQYNDRIYARHCTVLRINNKIAADFLSDNHLQGSINGTHAYGLFYKNKLVSVMTFGKMRKSMGSTSMSGFYELYRFCSLLGTSIPGAASKLLGAFIKSVSPKQIITYADRGWSNGNLYEKLGFKYVGKTKPNYHYIINDKRHSRFSFRKDVLLSQGYDPQKTEHEIMLERKIYRIYGCGNLKYTMLFHTI